MMTTHPDTLCYSCSKACTKECSWANQFIPVNGWTADKNPNGYCVYDCPEFVRDVYRDASGTEHKMRVSRPDYDNEGCVKLLEAALRKTREDYMFGFGPFRKDDRTLNKGANRRLIEDDIRSEHFCKMFHVDNPDDIIRFLRNELKRNLTKEQRV